MRVACLQFAPQVGDVDSNLDRADVVLNQANTKNLDLLVLPELASTGHISRYLEHTTSGITLLWARATALKHECVVTVGYPEKKFLYFPNKTWALEGPYEFFDGEIPGLGKVAMGMFTDLNSYKSEFASHVLHKQANLVIISMAWTTHQGLNSHGREPKEPDINTLSCWVARLEPLIRAKDEGEIIVVLANRCGTEGEAVYAGTSCVLGIEDGEVRVYGILGWGERELLVIDTEQLPQFKIVAEHNGFMQDDAFQSRHALTLDHDRVAARQSIVQGQKIDEGAKGSLDNGNGNVLAEIPAISLVEPLFKHQYFADERVVLQTTPMSDWDTDNKDHLPDSPSSMKVNTPWESSSSIFRAEDITKILRGPRSYE